MVGLNQLSLMQGIDSKLRERLLVARIDQLQADVKQVEEATKAAQEQAFRSGFVLTMPCYSQNIGYCQCLQSHSDLAVHQTRKGSALQLQEQVVSAA